MIHFSREDRDLLEKLRPTINSRLNDFSRLKPEEWGDELLVCLLTPQGSPDRADACIKELVLLGLKEGKLDEIKISEILRDPKRYIRFHNVKAKRILELVNKLPMILGELQRDLSPQKERIFLFEIVNGYGLKEASHALRNIGRRDLAILDRHILKNLVNLGVIKEVPKNLSEKRYLEVEEGFRKYADFCGIPMDVLDLFFWGKETGYIFK